MANMNAFESRVFSWLKRHLPVQYQSETFKWVDLNVRHYTPDFFLGTLSNGTRIFLETKGHPISARDIDRILGARKCNQGIDIWVLLNKDRLCPGCKNRTWSERFAQAGIRTAIGHIPQDWLRCLVEYVEYKDGGTSHMG